MAIILATWEAELQKTEVWGQPGQTVQGTLSPKQPEQNGLEVWPSGSVPALQGWSPEFKPQSHQKN
jgi:hypothetical protein